MLPVCCQPSILHLRTAAHCRFFLSRLQLERPDGKTRQPGRSDTDTHTQTQTRHKTHEWNNKITGIYINKYLHCFTGTITSVKIRLLLPKHSISHIQKSCHSSFLFIFLIARLSLETTCVPGTPSLSSHWLLSPWIWLLEQVLASGVQSCCGWTSQWRPRVLPVRPLVDSFTLINLQQQN